MKKVFVQTYGCQMNTADSEEMTAHLAAVGITAASDINEADIVLVNTCTVREHAEHRAVSYIGRLAKWKEAKEGRKIIFAGCAAQRLGEELKKDFPQVDIVFGAKDIETFPQVLKRAGLYGETAAALTETAPLSAYVTIMRGCNFKCSYCIVPSVRGLEICLPPEEILKAAEKKAAAGSKEIILLGQTVNAYKHGETDFSDLLDAASKIKGVERVRFMSPHPLYVTDKLINLFKTNSKIAKHMHLPVQSGSTRVLKEMKRGYSREQLFDVFDKLHSAGVALSTDIIVGYPTETEEDFKETLSMTEKGQFTFAYCFKFSPRDGTPAAALKNINSEKAVEKRLDILLNKVKLMSAGAYARCAGTTQEVLMETENKGRTSSNLWVRTNGSYKTGDLIKVFVERVEGTLLISKE